MLIQPMSNIDFSVPAEIFSKSKTSGWAKNPIKYRRFEHLSFAVKFVMEECGDGLNYVSIHTQTDEFVGREILSLYESENYPLPKNLAGPGSSGQPRPSATPPTSMSSHKFKIGDIVVFNHPGLKGREGRYVVVKTLPVENAEAAYRIKSEAEQYERVVKEYEISVA